MQERFYESGSCVQKNCAILGVHPTNWEQIENKLGTNYRGTPVK